MSWLLAVLDLLAVHRLTRLATKDVITQPWRDEIIRGSYRRNGLILAGPDYWLPQHRVEADMAEDPARTPRLAVLVSCRWCASVWISAPVAVATWVMPGVWQWAALALAASSVGTLLAGLEADG